VNTPAHVVLSALALSRGKTRSHWLAVTLGALMPDLPMFGFYLYQRVYLSVAEQVIWGELYFKQNWQVFFDLFNSLPLIAAAAAHAWWKQRSTQLAFFASMGLHCLADLPLHREDAHAHFYPFTDWHFVSPVSYWDPAHYGAYALALEAALVLFASFYLRKRGRAWGRLGHATLAIYVGFGVFAYAMWSSQL